MCSLEFGVALPALSRRTEGGSENREPRPSCPGSWSDRLFQLMLEFFGLYVKDIKTVLDRWQDQ